ncbi:gamma-glutamylcyclotransferase family protein [Rosenbergiella australiborealis]|uniref:Gamma-glutamylcyclotransferase n=1 Tax=Rosenbergiella australiborealis TaxID=1544696 RepID=A0ABS5T499_9GAMM|nr:gamma-glutamylcyclotransferase family protein [Rosenbergiella australiborealis]MBT0727178.1 gamma-glutamylcyclotransferase [Rosenbergiella australiborealis]
MKPLFVYGTLQPGRENEHLLTGIGGKWLAATVRGTYYEKAWGLAADFPGLILDPQGSEVTGYLFFSEQLADHWPELDAFEEGYDRVTVTALTAEGNTIEAWVYQVQPQD